MAPVIRIDRQVMDELEKRAVALRLVFGTPNEVLRAVLGLNAGPSAIDKNLEMELAKVDVALGLKVGPPDSGDKAIEVLLGKIHTARKYALIPIPKGNRGFFPGYKVRFALSTDVGDLTTWVTAAPKGTPQGDPMGGAYILGRLRSWYDKHRELKDGARLRVEVLEPKERYRLSILRS